MKKRILTIAAVLFLAVAPAMSQVFIMDDDEWNKRNNRDPEQIGVMVPMQDVDMDQWKITPIGEGVLVLAGLAGAYLLGKRRKDK